MRRIADIDILGDEALLQDMTRGSWLILGLGTALGLAGFLAGVLPDRLSLWWFLGVGALTALSLPVHELVHAALFKLFGGRDARVTFGARWGMLYTSAKGLILPRRQFMCVLLGPAVVVSLALFVAAALSGHGLAGWELAVLHLSGCTGDFGMVAAIRRNPAALLVEDTETGVAFYADR